MGCISFSRSCLFLAAISPRGQDARLPPAVRPFRKASRDGEASRGTPRRLQVRILWGVLLSPVPACFSQQSRPAGTLPAPETPGASPWIGVPLALAVLALVCLIDLLIPGPAAGSGSGDRFVAAKIKFAPGRPARSAVQIFEGSSSGPRPPHLAVSCDVRRLRCVRLTCLPGNPGRKPGDRFG